jgi:elongation factor P
MIVGTQIRVGMIIKYRDALCKVVSMQHQHLGRGASKIVVKLKNIQTGAQVEYKFRSDERVEQVRIDEHELEYLYTAGGEYCFMHTDTYEQEIFPDEIVEDIKLYLMPNVKYIAEYFGDKLLGIRPPRTMDLKVIATEPNLRGATVSSSMKPATLETGLVIDVPPFVEIGEVIRFDTGDNKYLERVS